MCLYQDFELLAAEILLGILSSITDLHSLYNLLRASPTSWRLFNKYPAVIFDAVVSGPQSVLAAEIQKLIRAVVLTRSSALPFKSLNEMQLSFFRNGKLPQSKIPAHTELKPGGLPYATSPAILWGILVAASQISLLTRACLNFYLLSIQTKGFHLLQQSLEAQHKLDSAWPDGILQSENIPRMKSGEGRGREQPSWVEEMRVARSFWAILLIYDIQTSASIGIAEAQGWPAKDLQELAQMEPEDIANFDVTLDGRREELLTIKEFVQFLHREDTGYRGYQFQLPQPPSSLVSTTWTTQNPLEVERTWAGIQYHYGDTLANKKPPLELRRTEKPKYTEGWRWGQTRGNLDQNAPGVTFHRALMAHDVGWRRARVKFDPLRHLGFAIWDQKRLHSLGLMDGADPPYHTPAFYSQLWISLLPLDDRAEVKAASEIQA